MKQAKFEFHGNQGHLLSGSLSLPADTEPHNYAIFAHCFTCNKNLKAVRHIILELTNAGFAVLSFDFTGLGNSEGEFSDTNFSSNIGDLIKANEFLAEFYKPASFIIGHSLGGAAALVAAEQLDSIKAVATIGAPAEASHVLKLIKNKDAIKKEGKAQVAIGGRPFTIRQHFLKDLEAHDGLEHVQALRKPLMILHSPQDNIVGIENARKIYEAAYHPKSFISLDGSDHLLSNEEDSQYAGRVIGVWAKRYLAVPGPAKLRTESKVLAFIGDQDQAYTTQLLAEGHHLIADEPEDAGGNNFGPSPYGLLSSALAACTAITMRMYANKKSIPVDEISVHVDQSHQYSKDSDACESEDSKITYLERKIEVRGALNAEQYKKMIEIANKCPVHKTLENKIKVETFALKAK